MVTPALPNITVAPGLEISRGSFRWSREGIDQALEEDPGRLNHPDTSGNRALHALVGGTLEEGFLKEDLGTLHKILRFQNIDLNSGNEDCKTPLHCVVRSFPSPVKTEVLQALLEAGADPNLANLRRYYGTDWQESHSETPLFTAVRWNRPDNLIQLLVAYGGRPAAVRTDSKGKKRAEPLSVEELERLAAMTEAARQQYMGPLQHHHLNGDVARIVAAYVYPNGPK